MALTAGDRWLDRVQSLVVRPARGARAILAAAIGIELVEKRIGACC